MDPLHQVNEAQEKVAAFLAPLVPLFGCHMVDFLTLGHWDTLLPPQLQQDLLSLPPDTLHLLPSAALPHAPGQPTPASGEPWSLSSSDLSSFLSQVRRHLPAALGVTTPTEQILGEFGSAEISVLAMKGIMSIKKTHEVDVMAQVVARLAKGVGAGWLVDLGSGRGYLSTSLVLQYGQSVVAIDSSTANTTSALVRNTKLKRWWDNLRRTWVDQAEGRPVRRGKRARRRKTPSSPQQQQEEDTAGRKEGDTGTNQEDRTDSYREEREDKNQTEENKNQKEREDKNHRGTAEESQQEERAERHQGGREEDSKQGEGDGKEHEDREEKDMSQEDREKGKEDKDSRNEDKEQENRSWINRKQDNMNQQERRQGSTQSQEDRKRQEGRGGQGKQDNTHNQERKGEEERQEDRRQEDKGRGDTTPPNTDSREGPSAPPLGHYIGVTKFITEDTDLLEVVRGAIGSETVEEGGGEGGESGVVRGEGGVVRGEAPPPGTGNTAYHCNTSNTSTIPPSPPTPDSPQDPASMLPVDAASTLGLVGLHTCGNLASSSLRLFVSNLRVSFLCNVGCCYHLLEEEFSRNTYNQHKIQVSYGSSETLDCGSGCGSEVEVSHKSAVKPPTDVTELQKIAIESTPKEESVASCESEVEISEGIGLEKYPVTSLKSHTERAGNASPTHRGSSEERRAEETGGGFAAAEEDSEPSESCKRLAEQEGTSIVQTRREEKRLPACEDEGKALEVGQENGAVASSAGHTGRDGCRPTSSSPVHREINAEERKGPERFSALTKDDCSFPKSSSNHTEEWGRSSTTGTTPLTQEEEEEEHSNKTPLKSSLPSSSHSPPDTGERAHEGSRSSPPPPPPPQDSINSPLQEPSSPLSPPTGRGRTKPSPLPSPRGQGGGGGGDVDPLHPSLIPGLGHGFPLSGFLRARRFSLGRNGRMLSSQAADRLTQGNIGGADSLYWRALLQVVLVDRLGDVSHLSHVGRLSAKCHTFPEYAQAALTRLGVSLEVTEEELQEYDRKHSSSKDRLERFFLLRASLAAVVEGAVLLDRLAFLREQDNVSAFLVPMFDPVTSPRCHALIAVRRRGRSSPWGTLTQGKEGGEAAIN